MKKASRKLNLNRETLIPLQPDELGNVNGGTSPATTITTSSAPCIETVSVVSASIASAVSRYFQSRGCAK
jgi:hypothetical protein